ncbi:hypothetical protein NM688_g7786 [Phlebia brevispora]|uniref:Uncharacterized protein n=1 Tax=Phlebia brevispora TaxID=194682 RepID=A0ACC1S1A0_9APHY|nr:hypothetical protein NM688_g7786 [Phlebia brevispora]
MKNPRSNTILRAQPALNRRYHDVTAIEAAVEEILQESRPQYFDKYCWVRATILVFNDVGTPNETILSRKGFPETFGTYSVYRTQIRSLSQSQGYMQRVSTSSDAYEAWRSLLGYVSSIRTAHPEAPQVFVIKHSVMVAIVSKEVTSEDGTKILVEAAGDSSKPALVFIHGFGLTGISFDPQFEDPRLNENLYLVRYDMRGHGRSGIPLEASAYESAKHAEDFKAVCDEFKLVKPNVLAWSLGGVNVVDVIEAYGADYLGNIIYCGGPLLTRVLHNNYIHPHLLSLIPDFLSNDADVVARAGPRYVESLVENPDKVFSYRDKLTIMGGLLSMPPTARIHLITRTQNSERWEKEIKSKKVIIIEGTKDRHTRADALVEEAKKWLGPFELRMLEDCGHSPSIERPHEVNGYILSFIQRNAEYCGPISRHNV